MRPIQRYTLILIPYLIAIGLFVFSPKLIVDDAYISFRYAAQFVNGNGLVFNPGEYVEGYSNLIWTLLHTIPIIMNLQIEAFSALLGLTCGLLTLFVLQRLMFRLNYSLTLLTALGILLALNYDFWLSITMGLEGGLYALFITIIIFLITSPLTSKNLNILGALCGLLWLVRPEGLVIAILAILTAFIILLDNYPKISGKFIRGAAQLLLPFCFLIIFALGIRYLYYNSFIPNTVNAKSSLLSIIQPSVLNQNTVTIIPEDTGITSQIQLEAVWTDGFIQIPWTQLDKETGWEIIDGILTFIGSEPSAVTITTEGGIALTFLKSEHAGKVNIEWKNYDMLIDLQSAELSRETIYIEFDYTSNDDTIELSINYFKELFSNPLILIVLVTSVAGAFVGNANRWYRLLLICIPCYIIVVIFLNGGDWMPYNRLFMPILPVILILTGQLLQRLNQQNSRITTIILICLLISSIASFFNQPLLFTNQVFLSRPSLNVFDPQNKSCQDSIGRAFNEGEHNNLVISPEALGVISYRALNFYFHDFLGLTDAEVSRTGTVNHPRFGKSNYEYTYSLKPDVFIFQTKGHMDFMRIFGFPQDYQTFELVDCQMTIAINNDALDSVLYYLSSFNLTPYIH